jgi:hypothetical protein
MNIRKGFFRLTLVLSFLCGILTLYSLSDDILGTRSRDIKITIPLPNDWQNRTLQEKLNSIDEVMIGLVDLENKTFAEERKASEEWAKFSAKRHYITLEDIEKENEKRKKAGLKPLPPRLLPPSIIDSPHGYSSLTSREQRNVKRRLKEQIISDEKKLPRDRGRKNYYVSSGPDWRELSPPIFVGFTIGFAAIWLIYAFMKWVVIGFIIGGFKGKSRKGGETDPKNRQNQDFHHNRVRKEDKS